MGRGITNATNSHMRHHTAKSNTAATKRNTRKATHTTGTGPPSAGARKIKRMASAHCKSQPNAPNYPGSLPQIPSLDCTSHHMPREQRIICQPPASPAGTQRNSSCNPGMAMQRHTLTRNLLFAKLCRTPNRSQHKDRRTRQAARTHRNRSLTNREGTHP